MRFFDKKLSKKLILSIIEESFEAGIISHHSSFEYTSYELYCASLKQFHKKNKIKHIVKLSSPHFDEEKFSGDILEGRIDNQLKALGIEQIDVLQWLVRSKPIDDIPRLRILNQQKEEIELSFHELKKKGKINQIFSFPYSVPFAEEVLNLKEIDGLIAYLNISENEYSKLADNVPFIAIRPFYAGNLIDNVKPALDVERCMGFVNSHKNVISKIVSINSLDHLRELMPYI